MNTLTRILASARLRPERPAFRLTRADGGEESVTYGQLLTRAEALADFLRLQGTGPVLTDARRTPDSAASVLACLMAGRPYVPLPPNAPPTRLKTMARLTRASFMIAPEDLPDMDVPRASAADLAARRTTVPPQAPLPRTGESAPFETAYILFTSGSTGEPKGVPISRRNLDSFTRWLLALEPFRNAEGMTVFGHALFSFDLSAADLYLSLCGGHTLAACEGDGNRPDAALNALSSCDAAVMTPAFLRLLLLDRDFTAEHYPRLRAVYLCGETLPPKTARRALDAFPELCLLNAYGPTEAASAVCAARITPDMASSLSSLPIGDLSRTAADIRVEDGEIVLRGDSVFGGYLPGTDRAEASRAPLREDGINGYRTGDLGEIRDGMLWFRGRRDSQIKYKGYRIEPGDIEANLSALPGVTDCAVVPKKNASGDIIALAAFVVPDRTALSLPADPAEPTEVSAEAAAQAAAEAEAELKTALAARIPSYMIPKTIRFLPRLPATENGKTDRGALLTL